MLLQNFPLLLWVGIRGGSTTGNRSSSRIRHSCLCLIVFCLFKQPPLQILPPSLAHPHTQQNTEHQRRDSEIEMMKKIHPLASVLSAVLFSLLVTQQWSQTEAAGDDRGGFIRARGTHFVLNGAPFYAHGFNAYWLMYAASDPSQRYLVSDALKQASSHGLSVARTWAFADAGYRPLQYSPGSYNEQSFQGLDFVVSEAGKYGVKLILSFVNNYESFGGKKQYVEWARSQGQYLSSEDDFFRSPLVKGFYKNHITTVLNRKNTITGVAYKDDPTIMAWELMNEPRCQSDPSGNTIQAWITEMAAHVKSIDSNHLLEVGLEGFYGSSSPHRTSINPGFNIGTDFIANNQIPGIDFATIHSYPDQWLTNSDDDSQLSFVNNWLDTHIEDAESVLKKPLIVAEFGKSQKDPGYSTSRRDQLFSTVYYKIYESAKRGGPAAGGLFWQLLTEGMDSFRDGYEVVLGESSSTADLIAEQSHRLYQIRKYFVRMRDVALWKRAKWAEKSHGN